MLGSRTAWRRIAHVVGGLCLGGVLTLPAAVSAEFVAPPIPAKDNDNGNGKDKKKDKKEDVEDEKNDKKKDKNGKEETAGLGVRLPAHLTGVPVLDLPGCKAVALLKQPALAAAQASYQAALNRRSALDTIHVPNFLARDLPIRKHQSDVGVNVAQLEVQRVQLDAVYSVYFGYLSAQYAAEQKQMLQSSRTKLLKLQSGVKAGIDAGKRNVRAEDEQRVAMYLNALDARIEEATQGEQRAMSALREALGVDPYSPLIIRAAGQFRLKPDLDKDRLVADALARRPEVQQATLLTEVHGLEVDAQALRRLFPTSPTFASGSDIHARPLPAGSYDELYRPAAVGPDMPVTINGSKCARADVAAAYHQRSGSMLEKTKNLIALETEQAYFRYLEACRKLPLLTEAWKNAQVVFAETDRSFQAGGKDTFTPRDWLAAGSAVTELRSQINQARYQLLIALAGLERATACGYQAGFEASATTDPPEPEKQKEKAKEEDNADEKNGKKSEKLETPMKEKNEQPGKPKPNDNEPASHSGPKL